MSHEVDEGVQYDFMSIMGRLQAAGIKNADFTSIEGLDGLLEDETIKNVLGELCKMLDGIAKKLSQDEPFEVIIDMIRQTRNRIISAVETLGNRYKVVSMGNPYFFTNWMKALVSGTVLLERAANKNELEEELRFLKQDVFKNAI